MPEAPPLNAPAITARVAHRGVLRRSFSFPVMLWIALAMLSVLTVRDRFSDPDLWWHLKTGEVIWNTHSVPSVDLFSYTTAHHTWTAHEWLSQVVIYAAWHLAGYTGLMALLCLLTSLLLIVQYQLSWLYSGNGKVALVGALVVWLFATIGLALRPQLFGYIFVSLELLLLELARQKNSRWLWWLPILFGVWVNIHGSFFLGLAILGITLICSCFDFEVGFLIGRSWQPEKRRTLAYVSGLCVAALFVNPVGIQQVIYPLDVMLRQKLGTAVVSEWQPLNFNEPRSLALLAVGALLILIPLLRRAPLYFNELVLTAVGLILAVQHQRMIFVFGLFAGPFLCRLLADTWEGYDPHRDLPMANAFMIALFICGIYAGFPTQGELDKQVADSNPVRAIDYLRSSHITGNMLNEYVYGGYLIWAAPEHPVFIDGRADVFEWTGVFQDVNNWYTLQADPNALLNKYRISFCLLSASSPMARVMLLLPGWKQVYSDNQAVIIAKSN